MYFSFAKPDEGSYFKSNLEEIHDTLAEQTTEQIVDLATVDDGFELLAKCPRTKQKIDWLRPRELSIDCTVQGLDKRIS